MFTENENSNSEPGSAVRGSDLHAENPGLNPAFTAAPIQLSRQGFDDVQPGLLLSFK